MEQLGRVAVEDEIWFCRTSDVGQVAARSAKQLQKDETSASCATREEKGRTGCGRD